MEIKRNKYLQWLESEKGPEFIKVLTGIRRVGKTTIMSQFKDTISGVNIIQLDFNDQRVAKRFSWESLINYVESKSKFNEINYLFFDEIQEIKHFEKALITLYSHRRFTYDIYITGSNSKMFSRELATLFTGRTKEIQVLPISYGEIVLNLYHNKSSYASLKAYLLQGGLGLTIKNYMNFSHVMSDLKTVYTGTIEKDIKSRHKIWYDDNLEKIYRYVFRHIGKNISSTNIENYLKSNKEIKMQKKTILNYFRWLEQAYLLYKVRYYDINGKGELRSKGKYYATDLGLFTLNTTIDIKKDYGVRLENSILLRLLEEGYDVYTGKDRYNHEIDFIVTKNNTIKYIQVCAELNDDNFERETRSLLCIKDSYEKIIITLECNVSDLKGIRLVDLKDYLLEKETI